MEFKTHLALKISPQSIESRVSTYNAVSVQLSIVLARTPHHQGEMCCSSQYWGDQGTKHTCEIWCHWEFYIITTREFVQDEADNNTGSLTDDL